MKSYKQILKLRDGDLNSFKKLKISILSDQSTQFLSKITFKLGIINSLNLKIWEAPIDQIDNQVFNPKSEFNINHFDLNIVFESTHSLLKKYNSNRNSESFCEEEFKRFKNLMKNSYSQIKQKLYFLIFTS